MIYINHIIDISTTKDMQKMFRKKKYYLAKNKLSWGHQPVTKKGEKRMIDL